MPNTYTELVHRRLREIPEKTDIFRVIDGVPIAYRNVFVDQLGDRILVSTRDRAIPAGLLAELRETGRAVYHKELNSGDKAAPEQVAGDELPVRFVAMEQGVQFYLDMSTGYSQGIFGDQRDNRQMIRSLCHSGMTVLNTFAYTGAFSVYAALAGATTTTLDLAQPCLTWAKENFALNGLNVDEHYFCKGDTFHWLRRFGKQGKKFDVIILDPPTFSRDKDGKVFRVEEHFGHLVELASSCLVSDGYLLCSTNCRKLTPQDFKNMVNSAVRVKEMRELPMPLDFDGDQYLKALLIRV